MSLPPVAADNFYRAIEKIPEAFQVPAVAAALKWVSNDLAYKDKEAQTLQFVWERMCARLSRAIPEDDDVEWHDAFWSTLTPWRYSEGKLKKVGPTPEKGEDVKV